MIKSKSLLSIIFTNILTTLSAQNIDSVMQTLADETLTSQIKVLDDLAWDHMYTNYEYAMNYGLVANKIAVESNLRKSAATTYNTLGVVCRRQGLYEKSKMYYQKAGKIWEEDGNQKQLMNFYQNMANVVRAQGINDSALYYGNEGLEIALALQDSFKISAMYVGLGTTYKNMGWDETAIDYYTIGAQIDQALGDTIGLGIYWSNIGDVLFKIKDYQGALDYYRQTFAVDVYDDNKLNQSITKKTIGMTFQQLGMPDSAMDAYNDGIELATEIGDDIMVADIYTSKADLLQKTGNPSESMSLYQKALEIGETYNDPILISNTALGLGLAYLKSNELPHAISNLKRANELARKIDNGTALLSSYQSLAEAYSKAGQTSAAFSNLQKYVEINDSLNSSSTLARIAELENKYELSNKNHQIELQASIIQQNELELQRNRAIVGGLIGLLILVSACIFLIYKRKQYKTQIRHEAEKGKMKEDQIRAVISSQEKERKRFAMDLHDDFGQLISALKLNVTTIGKTGKDGSASEKSAQILDNMYSTLKSIAFDLMPHTLFEKGLEEAIEELSEQITSSGRIQVDFQTFEIKDKISSDQKVAIYRVIQEVVSNCLKYSNADKINISITDLGSKMSLMIEDNGDGFDLETFKNGQGNGWKNIHSRIELMHGEIEFDTLFGRKNTTVSIEIPYLSTKSQEVAA